MPTLPTCCAWIPQNDLGRKYWHEWNPETAQPDYTAPKVPAGVPAWAYLQAKDVDYFKRIADFYIDKRQAWDGEFGGGLGDDSDFTNLFPSLALMGTEPEKVKASLSRELEAMYENKMWTNGLATGQFDELHAYEDGLNVLGQSMMMDFGNPKDIERAMVTARRLEWLTGVNAAGHRHVQSAYYSGSKMATGGVWGWTKARSYMVFQPALDLVLFNGAPETRKMVLETVDGMLAHRKQEADGRFVTRTEINFKTDEDLPGGDATPDFMFWAAYRWTGDKKYLLPFMDAGPSSLAQYQLRCAGHAGAARHVGQAGCGGCRSVDPRPSGANGGAIHDWFGRDVCLAGKRRYEVPRPAIPRTTGGGIEPGVDQHRRQPVDRSRDGFGRADVRQYRTAARALWRRRADPQPYLSGQRGELAVCRAGHADQPGHPGSGGDAGPS